MKPEQRLVNILFDDVKLLKTTSITCGHIIGLANNDPESIATSAFCSEIVCNHGGSLVIGIHGVSKINAEKSRTIELLRKKFFRQAIQRNGGNFNIDVVALSNQGTPITSIAEI